MRSKITNIGRYRKPRSMYSILDGNFVQIQEKSAMDYRRQLIFILWATRPQLSTTTVFRTLFAFVNTHVCWGHVTSPRYCRSGARPSKVTLIQRLFGIWPRADCSFPSTEIKPLECVNSAHRMWRN